MRGATFRLLKSAASNMNICAAIMLLLILPVSAYEIQHFVAGSDITSIRVTDIECDLETNSIWAGTGSPVAGVGYGLNRYHGREWTQFYDYTTSHLLFEFINDIEIDSDGGVWAACLTLPANRGGLLYFDGVDTWESIDTSWGLPWNPVAIVGTAHDDIWFKQLACCGIINPETWTVKDDTLGLFAAMGTQLSAVAILDETHLFTGFIDRVAIVQADGFYELPYDGLSIKEPVQKTGGGLCWKDDSTIYCLDDDVITDYRIPNTAFTGFALGIDEDNTFWYGDENLLAAFNPVLDDYTEYTVIEPLSISHVVVDAVGNKWFDGGDGIYAFNENALMLNTDEPETQKPANLEITCSPNPFNAAVEINIPEGYEAETLDIHGRIVHSLNTPIWNATGQPSGTYLVRAVKGDRVLTKKVVLVR